MPTEVPKHKPYDENYIPQVTITGKVKNPLTPDQAPFGVTADGRPVTRIASDLEFARVAHEQGIPIEDIAAGAQPKEVPSIFRSWRRARDAEKYNAKLEGYVDESQRRENISPNKAHAIAIEEAPFHERASAVVETSSMPVEEGVVTLGLLALGGTLLAPISPATRKQGEPPASMDASWGVQPNDPRTIILNNPAWWEQVRGGQEAAHKEALAYDAEQAARLV